LVALTFPRVGAVRALADGAILGTWYLESEEVSGAMTVCPYNDYDDTLHEIVDLSDCTYEEYMDLIEGHHESTLTKAGEGWDVHTQKDGKDVSRRLARRDL
jgi:hypothetical protein